MKVTASILLVGGFCVASVWSLSYELNDKGEVGKLNCEGTEMIVAIDNSNHTSNETFQFIKEQLKHLLFRTLLDDFRYENLRMSFHTFGENVYTDDEVGFSQNSSELLNGIDNLAYHGDQNPRVDNSLRHFQENLNSSGSSIYVYIGDGDSQYLDRLTERVQSVKENPDVRMAVLTKNTELARYDQAPELLKMISTNRVISSIQDDPFNIALYLTGYLGSCIYYFPDVTE